MLSEWLRHRRIPDTHVVAGLDLDAVQQTAGDPRKPATHPWVCDDKQRPKLGVVEYGRGCHVFEAILSCRLKSCLKNWKEGNGEERRRKQINRPETQGGAG